VEGGPGGPGGPPADANTDGSAAAQTPAGDENASGEPEDDVVEQNGAAQTPAEVAAGDDTKQAA